jgi:hypothetical protein
VPSVAIAIFLEQKLRHALSVEMLVDGKGPDRCAQGRRVPDQLARQAQLRKPRPLAYEQRKVLAPGLHGALVQ